MKPIAPLLICLFCVSCIFVSCNSPITVVARGTQVHIKFVDENGVDLLANSHFLIDTAATGPYYSLNKSEYSLRVLINEEEYLPDKLLYSEAKFGESYETLRFRCGRHDSKLTKKMDYVYSYYFACPKLFGDEEERLIEVVYKYKRKYIYDPEEIWFEGKLMSQGNLRNKASTIVL